MRKLVFIFILSITGRTFAQTYVPMPMQDCYWQMTHTKYCSQSTATPAISQSIIEYKVYPNADTVIAAKKYVKFYSQIIYSSLSSFCNISNGVNTGYWGAVRQDTMGRKIYLIYPNQTAENLLYNFNYVKGDTVKTLLGTYLPSPPPGGAPYRIVDSIYYQSYTDGICRKTFKLKSYVFNVGSQYTENLYFTEGIGNEVGLFEKQYLINSSNINSMSQEQWSSLLTISNFTVSATVTNTCAQNIGIKNNYFKNETKIFPNPAHDEITISNEKLNSQGFYIVIYDILGNEVFKSNNKTIKIDQLSYGAYLIKCFATDSKETFISKFIKN